MLQDDNARPHRARIVQQFLQQNNLDHLDPLTCRQSSMFGTFSASVYDREFHDQERSKFGRSLAGGVEEDTPATDCQTHQEYASSLCGLHRCNRWAYGILTDL